MYSGYREEDKRISELAVYLELLKHIESFEQTLSQNGIANDLFITLIARLGLLLDVINANGTLSNNTKRRIIKSVNEQINMLIDAYEQGKGKNGK